MVPREQVHGPARTSAGHPLGAARPAGLLLLTLSSYARERAPTLRPPWLRPSACGGRLSAPVQGAGSSASAAISILGGGAVSCGPPQPHHGPAVGEVGGRQGRAVGGLLGPSTGRPGLVHTVGAPRPSSTAGTALKAARVRVRQRRRLRRRRPRLGQAQPKSGSARKEPKPERHSAQSLYRSAGFLPAEAERRQWKAR